jgi:hypothetical protein
MGRSRLIRAWFVPQQVANSIFQFDIVTLAAGATVSGSFLSTAPPAGTKITLQFFILPPPVGVEFPPPNAEASILPDVAATYMIKLEKIHIFETRAPENDTDIVSCLLR